MPDASDLFIGAGVVLLSTAVAALAGTWWVLALIGAFLVVVGVLRARTGA